MTCNNSKRIVHRDGFTLVELLIVISIIGLLTATVLFAMAGAQENARADRTRAQIQRINSFITLKWAEFETVRVNVRMPRVSQDASSNAYVTQNLNPTPDEALYAYARNNEGRPLAFRRLYALRELQRYSLPDRISDLVDINSSSRLKPDVTPSLLSSLPGILRTYQRKAERLVATRPKNLDGSIRKPNDPNPNWRDVALTADEAINNPNKGWTLEHQGAECLYLILSQMVDDDVAALESFKETEIGDVDNDGMPEILDAWGTPIGFIRWAPGFFGPGTIQSVSTPDPFDPLQVDQYYNTSQKLRDLYTPYALYPLVFSFGPDKESDTNRDPHLKSFSSYVNFTFQQKQGAARPNCPYAGVMIFENESSFFPLGAIVDLDQDGENDSADDIHNHLITTGR